MTMMLMGIVKPPSTSLSATVLHLPFSASINSNRPHQIDPFSPTAATRNGKLAPSF